MYVLSAMVYVINITCYIVPNVDSTPVTVARNFKVHLTPVISNFDKSSSIDATCKIETCQTKTNFVNCSVMYSFEWSMIWQSGTSIPFDCYLNSLSCYVYLDEIVRCLLLIDSTEGAFERRFSTR